MALICGSALLGFFGGGQAANVTVKSTGLELHYERFLRLGDQSEIVIKTPSGKWPSSLELRSDFLEWANIRSVQPNQDALKPTPTGLAINTAAMGGNPVLRIRYESLRPGRHLLRLSDSEAFILDARCWVYP